MSHLQSVPDEPHEAPQAQVPHDPAAERSVLGSVLLNPKMIHDVHDSGLRGDDFHAPRHETIWAAIGVLADRGLGIDAVTVAATLQESGELARAGGPAYLHQLTAEVATPANVSWYARIVVERAHKRRLLMAGQRITQLGMDDAGGCLELIEAAASEVALVADRAHGRGGSDIDEAIEEALNELEVGIPAVPSGIPDLDELIHGWIPGHLVTIGARPSVGKSAGLMQCVLAAIGRGEPAGMTSLEMGRSEIIHRAAANLGGVDFGRLRRSPDVKLTEAEWRAIAKAAAALRTSAPSGEPLLHLSDRTDVTVAQIRHDIRSHARKHGRPPTVWAVDYLQLLKPSRESAKEGRERQVAALARDLKLTAKSERTCILVGSQLNRAGNDKPGMIHLRESGAVEQDSDRVILLHRDLDPDADQTVMEWIVAKNRQGRAGVVTATWEGSYQRVSRKQWSPSKAVAS